ncbi:MAG: pyocin knob domain-containing protein, partial [Spirochaetaceae bacterium]|nr:pyocin knob domain-containing protein [Spirochaetaceae bacterium]
AAGFFTSYVGANTNISRQEYRPANSNKVYERYKNGGSWSGWVRTDAASVSPIADQLWEHCIYIRRNNDYRYVTATIHTNNNTQFTFESLRTWLIDNGFNNSATFPASGGWPTVNTNDTASIACVGLRATSTEIILLSTTGPNISITTAEIFDTRRRLL